MTRSATRRRIGKDPAYLEWIRTRLCLVCMLETHQLNRFQMGTEAAHVGERGLSQKCPDREAIPLCAVHHRLDRFSAHRMGKSSGTITVLKKTS